MRKAMVPAVLILLLLFAFPGFAQTTTCTSALPSTTAFNTALLGSNVANNLGNANGFANAGLTFNGNTATLNVNTLGLGNNITGVTLYQGQPGAGGIPVFTFTDQNNVFVNGRFSRTVPLDQNLVNQIEANPSNYFFVVSTAQFPNGAVQGQLAPSGPMLVSGVLLGGNISGGAPNATGTILVSAGPSTMAGMVTLRYDILTNGIGNNFTTISVMPVGGVTPLFTLNNLAAASNGRLTGTIDVPQAVANQLLSNPCAFTFSLSTPAFPNGAIAGTLEASNDVFLPVVGSVHGENGTNYMTDISIFDNSAIGVTTPNATANVYAQFYPSGVNNANAVAQNVSTMTINPRGTTTLRDINNSIFNGALNGIGALRIISSGSVLANARIYNNQIANGRGTFGQFEPGMTRSQALSQGVLVGIGNVTSNPTLANGQSFRTNIGFFNPNDAPTTVALELRDSNGNILGNATVNLAPWEQIQMPLAGSGGVFAVNGDIPTGAVYFLSGNPIFAYASVIDNVSGDASFVTPSFQTPFTP